MSFFHAVVLIDHHSARVLQFDADHEQIEKIAEHLQVTRQHNSSVRTEHEFYGDVCDALKGIKEILLAGSHMAQADFRHYVVKHRPLIAQQIVGWETVDHPTEEQLLAFARSYFSKHERLASSPPS